MYLMEHPFVKLPCETSLQLTTDRNRTLDHVEGHVNVRIRHKTTNGEPGDRVVDQCNHEKSPFVGVSLYSMFFLRDLDKKRVRVSDGPSLLSYVNDRA